MWKDNKYKDYYFKIIEKAALQNRKKALGTYFEKHHIVPKSMGGDNRGNTVLLTAREHFLCHWLLVKAVDDQYVNKMKYAIWKMTRIPIKGERVVTSWQYDVARKKISEARRSSKKNTYIPSKKGSLEHRAKMSRVRKGKLIGPASEESKRKRSEAMKKIWSDPETRRIRSLKNKEFAQSESFRNKCSIASLKRWKPDDSRQES